MAQFFCHRHFYKVSFFPTVWLRFFSNSHFINCIFLSCTVAHFFRHSHFYRVPFFVFNCLVPIFLVTVIFIRRNFILRCLDQIFLATVIFIRCHFFQLFGSGFFGNSDSLNCIFLSCTVWLIFFRHRHFYKVPFFIFNCLAPIFLATVIFI